MGQWSKLEEVSETSPPTVLAVSFHRLNGKGRTWLATDSHCLYGYGLMRGPYSHSHLAGWLGLILFLNHLYEMPPKVSICLGKGSRCRERHSQANNLLRICLNILKEQKYKSHPELWHKLKTVSWRAIIRHQGKGTCFLFLSCFYSGMEWKDLSI